jgi:hypothetical protein
MGRKNFTLKQIISKWREAKVSISHGILIAEVSEKSGVTG